jgi:hypothetical protein
MSNRHKVDNLLMDELILEGSCTRAVVGAVRWILVEGEGEQVGERRGRD